MSAERADHFTLSRPRYAIDRESFRAAAYAGDVRMTVRTVYLRRTRGVLGVHLGELWDHTRGKPLTLDEFLDRLGTARYGPRVLARWTGDSLWTPRPVADSERTRLLAVLRPAFDHLLPLAETTGATVTPPPGWDGWYLLADRPRG